MTAKVTEWFSDEWCRNHHARTQEQLQQIAGNIRKNCKCTKVMDQPGCHIDGAICTEYENENLGVQYIVKDTFGHIEEITEIRRY